MKKLSIFTIVIASCFAAFAQQSSRESFMKQQAMAEMSRVSGQIDLLQNNVEDLQRRLGKLESRNGDSDIRSLRAEIDSLKATVSELKRQLANQRGEIVKDLSSRIAKMQPAPEPAPKPTKPAFSGPASEYTVQAGDSLYLIAKAFNTTVAKIREINNLKNDNLRVGQKIIVPEVK